MTATVSRVSMVLGFFLLSACGSTKPRVVMGPPVGDPSYIDLIAHCDPWFPRLGRAEPDRNLAANLFARAKVADQFGPRDEAVPLCQRFLARKSAETLPTAFAWCEDLVAEARDH